MKQKPLTFEKRIERLQAILAELEAPDTTFDRMLELYETGIEMVGDAVKELSAFENRVKILRERANGLFELEEYQINPVRDAR